MGCTDGYAEGCVQWARVWMECAEGVEKMTDNKLLMFDEEVIRNLLSIKKLLVDMKTRFDHVRGDVESREVMSETIDRAIEIIKCAADTPR